MPDNVALIQSMYHAFEHGDVPFILDRLADDVEWICAGPQSLPFCGTFTGPGEVVGFFEAMATTQTAPRFAVDEIFGAEGKVVVIGRSTGTVTATGKQFDERVAHIFTLRDGKVVRFLDFIDTAKAVEAYSPSTTAASA